MFTTTRSVKRTATERCWGRGVTAAFRTFNPAGVGSNPSGPTREYGSVERNVLDGSVARMKSVGA